MRFPGDPDGGALRGGAVHSPADATLVETDAQAAPIGGIFPTHRPDSRARQLEETWLLLFRELRGPVDSTLAGGLSAGDVAYRLGELVHNFFRTRGVTLTSFELRRIVVELLDNHKRGWPTLKPPPGPSAPVSSLVDFVDGDPDARAIRQAATLPPEATAPPPVAPPVVEALPSPLVIVEPRPGAQAAPTTVSGLSVDKAGPGAAVAPSTRAVVPRPMPRRPSGQVLSSPDESDDTLTPEQIASMEAAAADAAEAVFGGEASAAELPPVPPATAPVASVDAVSDDVSAETALVAIATAWDRRRVADPPPTSRVELGRWVSRTTAEALADIGLRIGAAQRARLEQLIVDDFFGLGVLEPLLRDAGVTAIMVNAPDAVFVERRGQIERVGGFRDQARLAAALERLARFAGKPAAGAVRPLVEGRLPDGGRFVIVSPPLAPSGPLCTITRPPAPTSTLDDLVGLEALSRPMATLLRAAARGRLNILVSGRAESGRTTMLSALARAVAPGERVVTVERRPELRLDLGNVVSLVAPEAGPEMVPAIDLSLAISAASRLRPDRLVIDGLGNGAVAALVSLIDGGRDGVVASCEASSPGAALEELARHIAEAEPRETLAAARTRVAGAFDLVVHLEAFRDGTRRVAHIAEVAGADSESVVGLDLFTYDPASSRPDGGFVGAGRRPLFLPRLAKLGLDQDLFDPA
jgi:pilus assembly protein CpaF